MQHLYSVCKQFVHWLKNVQTGLGSFVKMCLIPRLLCNGCYCIRLNGLKTRAHSTVRLLSTRFRSSKSRAFTFSPELRAKVLVRYVPVKRSWLRRGRPAFTRSLRDNWSATFEQSTGLTSIYVKLSVSHNFVIFETRFIFCQSCLDTPHITLIQLLWKR